MIENGAILTVSSAARTLNRCEATVRNWADRGVLRSVRTATGTRLFSRDDVELLARELGARR